MLRVFDNIGKYPQLSSRLLAVPPPCILNRELPTVLDNITFLLIIFKMYLISMMRYLIDVS
jgi:hypothetical protein